MTAWNGSAWKNGETKNKIKTSGTERRENWYFVFLKNNVFGIHLPRKPHRTTRLLQLIGRLQYHGIM